MNSIVQKGTCAQKKLRNCGFELQMVETMNNTIRLPVSYALAAISAVSNDPSQMRAFFFGLRISVTHMPQGLLRTPLYIGWRESPPTPSFGIFFDGDKLDAPISVEPELLEICEASISSHMFSKLLNPTFSFVQNPCNTAFWSEDHRISSAPVELEIVKLLTERREGDNCSMTFTLYVGDPFLNYFKVSARWLQWYLCSEW